VEQRISFVTLGVADVARARAFYERLGWTPSLALEEIVFFQANGMAFSLWGRDELAEASGVAAGGGWGGVRLAHNLASNDEVDALIEQARAAGARISREPAPTFYGGYAGVFVDLDGHPWEIACNPGMPLNADGTLTVPTSL
jgi:catechol 2,3-dioxygenase-like lactoylglutathione lyase family enzyme